MKITFTLGAAALLAGVAFSAAAQDAVQFTPPGQGSSNGSAPAAAAPAAPAVAPVPPPPTQFTDLQLTEELGWWIAKKVGIAELQLSPEENAALVKGFTASLNGQDAPYDVQQAGPQMEALMQKKNTDYLAKLKMENAKKEQDFFASLKDNKNVVRLPSGLCYEILTPGAGDYPKPTDVVKVHYTGTLLDGSVFDSSDRHGGQPFETALDRVIPGWTEGLQKINKGGKIKLYIPAALAYGDRGNPGIPPGSTLIFEVELLDFHPASATPSVAPAMPMPPSGQQ